MELHQPVSKTKAKNQSHQEEQRVPRPFWFIANKDMKNDQSSKGNKRYFIANFFDIHEEVNKDLEHGEAVCVDTIDAKDM